MLEIIAKEAHDDPEMVKGAPHKCAVHKRAAEEELDDPDQVGHHLEGLQAQARREPRSVTAVRRK